MSGSEIKATIKAAGLKLWQVAKEMGMNDGNFSRKLRNDFWMKILKSIKCYRKAENSIKERTPKVRNKNKVYSPPRDNTP